MDIEPDMSGNPRFGKFCSINRFVDSAPIEFMAELKSVCKSVLEYHDLAKTWDIDGPSNVFAPATAIDEDS